MSILPSPDLITELESLRRENAALRYELQNLDRRIEAIENSRMFRFSRWVGAPLLHLFARAAHTRRLGGPDPDYESWMRENCCLPYFGGAANRSPSLKLSLIVHAGAAVPGDLERTVRSLRAQSYPHWEALLVGQRSKPVAPTFNDARVRGSSFAGQPLKSELLSQAVKEAGDWIGILEAGDILSPEALECFAVAAQDNPDLIYSDEDTITASGQQCRPVFKPGWSPWLLLSSMYVGRFFLISRQALARNAGFRVGFEGAELYDLLLRLSESQPKVRHIPRVLFHGHDDGGGFEPLETSRLAIVQALERRSLSAKVAPGAVPFSCRIQPELQAHPIVTVIVCSRNPKLMRTCLRELRSCTHYQNLEIVAVQHLTGESDERMQRAIEEFGCTRIAYEGAFNFSDMNNRGATASKGEILVFLNDDVAPLTPDWLQSLAAWVLRPGVAIAGAKLLYPSGAIQHAGITLGILDGAGHLGRGLLSLPYWPWIDVPREVSAVTGACLCVGRQVFESLGGFDVDFAVNYNDVDLCLRARASGYAVICEPAALLRHSECQTRRSGTRLEERALFWKKWSAQLEKTDFFYTPNLSADHEGGNLSRGRRDFAAPRFR